MIAVRRLAVILLADVDEYRRGQCWSFSPLP